MTNITNLQRDGIWTKLNQSQWLEFSSDNAFSAVQFLMNDDGNVYKQTASVQSDHTAFAATAAASNRGLGILIQPPINEIVPYRIKAHVDSTIENIRTAVGIGYASGTNNGVDDIVTEPVILPFERYIDELVMIPQLPDTDPNYGKPLGIAVLISDNATATIRVMAHLSVQNLGVSPPAFTQSTA